MRADSEHNIQVFDSLSDALSSLNLSNSLLVTRGTGLENLEGEFQSLRVLKVPDGEPKLADLLSLDGVYLKGVRRIVSIGGGSVIDFGKGLLSLIDFPELRKNLSIYSKTVHSTGSSQPSIDHIAIPTRAGSGAEASSSAIFTNDLGKFPIVGKSLLPKSVLWVPSLLTRNPTNALVGILDMMGHAVESLLSTQRNKTLDLAALDVVRSLVEISAKKELTHWDNLRLLSASYSAGRCQDLRLVSLPHALAHHFSFGMPHGLLVGNFLSQFLNGLENADKEKYGYLEQLFLMSNVPLREFQISLEDLVSRCNRDFGVGQFEKFSYSEAEVAFSDPSSRLTSLRITEHNFLDFNFQKPVKVA
jgi:alcohol dehydrogenase